MPITKRLTSFVFSLAILALPVVIWVNHQALLDWWKLRGYNPPPSVVKLSQEDGLTDTARHIFYVNHPLLADSAAAFNQECPQSEQTIVLGCYHSGQNGIAIYNVKDARLGGVQEVTAAHEMLHAAYDRLSSKDKNYIDGLLTDYYAHDLHDQRILNTMNLYKKTEPHDVVDEMHSVFGTEIANLPAPLENYYQRYFTNRSAVANFAAGYQAEFSSRINQINDDDQRLAAMKKQIQAEEQNLQVQQSQLDADRSRLDSLRSSGQIDAFNAAVPGFNVKVAAYNQGVNKLQRDIAAYNQLVNDRNAIASDLRGLQGAIDTRLTTQGTQ